MSLISNQKGMTLIEVLLACAITSAIVGGLSVAIFSVIKVTERGNAESAALHDLQMASYWINNDAQMALITSLQQGSQTSTAVSMNWTDSQGSSHTCNYWLSDNKLKRNLDGTVTTAALNITSVGFSISGNMLTYRIQSTPPGRWGVSRQSTGMVYLRPKAGT
jgi:type II secretory pathway component PulJ